MATEPKRTYVVQPQRSNGKCYVDCEPHRATSWEVHCLWTRKGKQQRTHVGRWATKTQAEGSAAHMRTAFSAPKVRSRKVIARSLTQEEYLKLTNPEYYS